MAKELCLYISLSIFLNLRRQKADPIGSGGLDGSCSVTNKLYDLSHIQPCPHIQTQPPRSKERKATNTGPNLFAQR